MPASSDARAPQITRASTSRPISSVPNQCADDGALRIALQLVASGSCGESQGAKIATTRKNTITASAITAMRRRSKRRNARAPGLDSRTGTASMASVAMPSAAQARIHEVVRDVREQIEGDVCGGREQHHALHHGVITIEHGVDDELAEA